MLNKSWSLVILVKLRSLIVLWKQLFIGQISVLFSDEIYIKK